jgi:hypothetical protein
MNNDQILDSTTEVAAKPEIDILDVNKFFMLSLLSLGLYEVWWMYKAWRFFKEKENLDILPVARAIFSILFIHSLFEKIQRFAQSNGYTKTYSSGLLTAIFILLNLIVTRLPDPYWMIAFASIFCFAQPLSAFNFAIENSRVYAAKRSGYSAGEIVVVILGAIFWVLIIIELMASEV